MDETNNNSATKGVNVQRDELGRLKKGSVLNPNGNLGARWLSKALEEAILKIAEGSQEETYKLLVKRVLKKAIQDGNDRSIELIWDRLEGKPKKEIDITSNGKTINSSSTIIFKDFDSVDEIEKENKEQNGTDSQ